MPNPVKGSQEAKDQMAKIRELGRLKREALKNVSIAETRSDAEGERSTEEPIIEVQADAEGERSTEPIIEVQALPTQDIISETKIKAKRAPRSKAKAPKQEVQVIKAPPRPKKKIIIEEDDDDNEEIEIIYKASAKSQRSESKAPAKAPAKVAEITQASPTEPMQLNNNPLLFRRVGLMRF